MILAPLSLVVAAIVVWLAIGAIGLVRVGNLRFVSRVLFPAGALVGLALAFVAGYAIRLPPTVEVLPLGLPNLPFHLRLDALSAFFLLLLGSAGAGDLALFRRLLPLERGHARRA
jgi:formate hydrogenlyase subunit 3/multisubunit Na+/H+ antiporter MnhD subunit